MGKVIAVKVSDEIKKKVEKLKDRVNWPEEIRRFIQDKIRDEEAEDNMKNVIKMIEATKPVPQGFSVSSVREDRDRS
ncbi:MAG: hypothetical protein QXN62_08220 [Candidatus Bathyarchaeia archaeon]